MKRVFGQTVREIKREMNKKVSKVPGIEQKILDSTNNEPFGPHGSHLSDLAHATFNGHEYHIIMTVIWKRINDTGKNWRHVYKALTVLEYLLIRGSEHVINEIKRHTCQISILAGFQYIDSSGRDQGSNVRKKAQSLIALVNNRERIEIVRQKAFTKTDKSRRSFSIDSIDKPSLNTYPGDYRNERHSDVEYRGHSKDDFQFGSGIRKSTDSEAKLSIDGDNDHCSSRRLEHKLSGKDVGAPTQKKSSPPPSKPASPCNSTSTSTNQACADVTETSPKEGVNVLDDFDPRGSLSAVSSSIVSPEMDLLGSDSINSLVSIPLTSATTSVADPMSSAIGMDFGHPSTMSPVSSQPFEGPFGYNPFMDTPDDEFTAQQQSSARSSFSQPSSAKSLQLNASQVDAIPGFDFGLPIDFLNSQQLPSNPESGPQACSDPLGSIFPQTSVQTSQLNFMQANVQSEFSAHTPQAALTSIQPAQTASATNMQTVPFDLLPQTNLLVPSTLGATQPAKKFEPKSAIWADTLSRGLVDLNISGPKTNPLADIGIDFDSINRREKRKEAKSFTTTVTSTVAMGKAMGVGSGIGRAGASGLVPPPNTMMGSCMSMGMACYGWNTNQPMSTGLGMNMGIGPGAPLWTPNAMLPPAIVHQGLDYNPMMGMGGYNSQQHYGGAGYR